MPERSRDFLKQQFSDGERPSGADFGDIMDSFINKVNDGISLDANNNVQLANGLAIKDAPDAGQAGTIRFHNNQLQINTNGTTTGWQGLATGNAGAFSPVGNTSNVAFNGGNVGIGDFQPATPPTFRLEVILGANTGADQRVRFGNAVLSNGQGASAAYAQFSNQAQSAGNDNFAIRQGSAGDVNLNAPLLQPITVSHGRTQSRLFIAPTGQVVIASNALIAGANGVLQVNGQASKNSGGNTWEVVSDMRVKQDVRPFNEGLTQLLKVQPVRFRYNGMFNTDPSQEEVGIVGQEIEKVFPYMISRQKLTEKPAEDTPEDILMYNGNALTYVMVNAIQELANRVVELEKQLAERAGKEA